MLAFAEIRRARGRFISIIGALALITFLVLTLSALSDGLFYGSTGAYRSSNANGYAFSSDAEGSLIRSRVPVTDVAKYQQIPGVTKASGVGVLLSSGTGPNGELDLAVFGIEPGGAGVPTTLTSGRLPEPGEDNAAAVDKTVVDKGAGIGSTIKVGYRAVTVVGVTQDSNYQLQPTIWTTVPTWRAMQSSVRPETRGLAPNYSAVALEFASGTTAASIPPVNGTAVLSTEEAAGNSGRQGTAFNVEFDHLHNVAGCRVGCRFVLRPHRARKARTLRGTQGTRNFHQAIGEHGDDPSARGISHWRHHRDRRVTNTWPSTSGAGTDAVPH